MNSLTFLCSQLILPGSEAMSLCCATAGRGTWHSQHPRMHESVWEGGGGKKAAARGEPPPAADSTGMISQALAGDSPFLQAGNAPTSCHPYTPELPQQALHHQIQVSLPNQPHQSSLSAGVEEHQHAVPTVPNPHPGHCAPAQVLGERHNFVRKAAALSPAY